jgi:hypothetical protein
MASLDEEGRAIVADLIPKWRAKSEDTQAKWARATAEKRTMKREATELLAHPRIKESAELRSKVENVIRDLDAGISKGEQAQLRGEQDKLRYQRLEQAISDEAHPKSAATRNSAATTPAWRSTTERPRRPLDDGARAAARQNRLVDDSGRVHQKNSLTGKWELRLNPVGLVEREVTPFTGTPVPRSPFAQPAREPFTGWLKEGPDGGPLYRPTHG